ncbi:acetamidase/formamidase family protein [Pelomyxa schiedti]|nr:acetamidase/formamidase family protein [Pelomyxa schiedti]
MSTALPERTTTDSASAGTTASSAPVTSSASSSAGSSASAVSNTTTTASGTGTGNGNGDGDLAARLSKSCCTSTFDRSDKPIARVPSGSTVMFETNDFSYQEWFESGELCMEAVNRVTGPLYVEGAEAGDALDVQIISIQVTSAWHANTNEDNVSPCTVTSDGQIMLSERLSIPVDPMIGCIATANTTFPQSTLAPCYPNGGNMDLREIGPGCLVSLPVFVPGALLYIGDLHAAMGQGEAFGAGLEAAGEVVVKVTVRKNVKLPSPRLLLPDGQIVCIGIGSHARGECIKQAMLVLIREYHLTSDEARKYAVARVGLRYGGPADNIILAVFPPPPSFPPPVRKASAAMNAIPSGKSDP